MKRGPVQQEVYYERCATLGMYVPLLQDLGKATGKLVEKQVRSVVLHSEH